MSVYLGTFGKVELLRSQGDRALTATIRPSDVNVAAKRFSFSNIHQGQLITGDKVRFSSTDNTVFDLISGETRTSIEKWVYVDEAQGIRLFNSFAHAVNGLVANAVTLAAPANNLPVRIEVRTQPKKILAQVQNYELNTERETVDTTTLSDEFRTRLSTLMSGSGSMSCFWEYTGDTVKELPNYLIELILRTKTGSKFHAEFYLKAPGYNPGGVAVRANDQVYYEFDAVITGCAVQFSTKNIVQITADFITTGPVQLRMKIEVPDSLTQEDSGGLVLNQEVDNTSASLGVRSDA